MRPSEGVSSLAISNILFGGLFITVLHSTFTNNVPPSATLSALHILAMDLFLVIPILMLAWNRDPHTKPSFWTSLYTIFRWVCWSAYLVWFWYSGLDATNALQCMEPRVFYCYNFGAYGNVRTFFKILSTLFAVVSSLGCLATLTFGRPFSRLLENFETDEAERRFMIPLRSPTESPMPNIERNINTILDMMRGCFRSCGWLVAALWLGFIILATELQIKWNHLEGLDHINSSGQILPLTVDVFRYSGVWHWFCLTWCRDIEKTTPTLDGDEIRYRFNSCEYVSKKY
jgi:hypothetical protein